MTEGSGRQKIVWGKAATTDDASPRAEEGEGTRGGGRRFSRPTKHVFITGMDLFTTEEIEKREKRAERFSTDVGIKYKPVETPEDELKKKKRAERFGTEYKEPDLTGLMEVDLLEKRKEAEESSSSRLDTIHMYGVDLLSTKDVLKYFSEYYPQYVEWINDSSCNVVFSDSGTAKRVLAALGRPLADSSDDPNSVDQLYRSMGKTWHKGNDFLKNGTTPVPIIFRLATEEDVKPKGKGQSRYLWQGGGRRQRKRKSGRDVEMRDAKQMRSEGYRDLRQVMNRGTERAGQSMERDDSDGRDLVNYDDI